MAAAAAKTSAVEELEKHIAEQESQVKSVAKKPDRSAFRVLYGEVANTTSLESELLSPPTFLLGPTIPTGHFVLVAVPCDWAS